MNKLTSRESIDDWLHQVGVKKYKINDDLTVDVNGMVFLSNKNLTIIPVQFNIVRGNFFCNKNKLNSLRGSPIEVFGDFNCSENLLENLLFCSKIIHGSFICIDNKLKSLLNGPIIVEKEYNFSKNKIEQLINIPEEICGNFNCSNNMLKNLKSCPKKIKKNFICDNNLLDSLEFIPEEVIGKFSLKGNKNLSSIQEVNNFNQIKKISETFRLGVSLKKLEKKVKVIKI